MQGFVPARRGPFAETKGPRLQGRNPAFNNSQTDPVIKTSLDLFYFYGCVFPLAHPSLLL